MHKYDPRGRHLLSWGEPGTDPGCFNIPHIATDGEGHVYVADRENHRVQIFDAQGRYLAQWNNLHRPCGLSADRRNGGLFYVGARVSVLSIKGDLVGRVGGRFAGEQPGEFIAPHGCAVESRGDLYVVEVSCPPREIRSLQKFTMA